MNEARQIPLAGVMGYPVGHSLSPRLHGFWLNRYQVPGFYVPLPVRPQDFEQALRALPKLGFRGANVTVPHKETACHLVDERDDTAEKIGAVNTVIVGPDGHLLGTNTDAFGFIENLKDKAGKSLQKNKPAMVLGAGGAARGVVYALLDAGFCRVLIANRTLGRALEFENLYPGKVTAVHWSEVEHAMAGIGLLINTTTLGMVGNEPLQIKLTPLPADAVVSDIVYNPLMTPLLQTAKARGHVVVDGLGMLLHQARPGFKAWFEVEPEVDNALRQHVLSALQGE